MKRDGTGLFGRTLPPSVDARGLLTAQVAWRLRVVGGRPIVLHQRALAGAAVQIAPGGYGSSADLCHGGIVDVVATAVDTLDAMPVVATIPTAVFAPDFAVSPDGKRLALVATGNSWRQDVGANFVVVGTDFPSQKSVDCQEMSASKASARGKTPCPQETHTPGSACSLPLPFPVR